jgi:hypothetical protein
MEAPKPEGWVLVDPKEALPCSLGVVVPESRVDELARIEQEGRQRPFLVRAVLSDHVPLAGSMSEILNRPSHHRVAVADHKLSIYLHHGGDRAVYFDLIGTGPEGWLDYIEVVVRTKYPAKCFWSARTAVAQLLDSMMRTKWLPLTIRRLDLYLEDDHRPLCQQLMLPFTDGIRWGPLGGIHQYPFLAPYEALIREAITTGSPYYRFLCAYRLYEGIPPLRKMLRELGVRAGVSVTLPKPQPLDLEWLRRFGIQDEFLAGMKNVEDFWQRTAQLRNAAAHFLIDGAKVPVSFSDGPTYQTYSLVGALLLHYSHTTFQDLSRSIPLELDSKLQSHRIRSPCDRGLRVRVAESRKGPLHFGSRACASFAEPRAALGKGVLRRQ